MQFRRIGNVVIHYRLDGEAGVPPLVFSNSLGTDLRVWDPLLERLGTGFRVLRYDKRGHGLSDAPPAPYRLDDHVDDLIGLLDHLDVDQPVICGLSVGGMIAQAVAARQPDRVRALVLCDTAPRIGNDTLWNTRIKAVTESGIEPLADGILERWFSKAFRRERTEELAGWRNMLTRTPRDGYAGTCAAIRDSDLSETTAQIRVPTLAVCGSEDGATPPDLVRGLIDLIPGARFHLIEGVGHLPCVEAPQELADAMHGFFRENRLV